MAMWNETDLDITFEDDMDHSAVVRECFGVASLEDDADGFLYSKSFSGNSGKYNISYNERTIKRRRETSSMTLQQPAARANAVRC